MASKVKHCRYIFLEMIVKISKQVFILVTFMTLDLTATIYKAVVLMLSLLAVLVSQFR